MNTVSSLSAMLSIEEGEIYALWKQGRKLKKDIIKVWEEVC